MTFKDKLFGQEETRHEMFKRWIQLSDQVMEVGRVFQNPMPITDEVLGIFKEEAARIDSGLKELLQLTNEYLKETYTQSATKIEELQYTMVGNVRVPLPPKH